MPLEVKTERPGIILRQFTPHDARPLFELIDRNREHLSRYPDEDNKTIADKYPDLESVRRSITEPKEPAKLRFGIWDCDTLVGTVNLRPKSGGMELGYWIGSDYTRRGYATIAAKAASDYAFAELGCRFLGAFTHIDNLTSQGVLERCGFRKVGRMSATAFGFLKNRP